MCFDPAAAAAPLQLGSRYTFMVIVLKNSLSV